MIFKLCNFSYLVEALINTCSSAQAVGDEYARLLTRCSPKHIKQTSEAKFKDIWESERWNNRKLGFYNAVKHSFGLEPYLQVTTYKECRRTAQLRTSGHQLAVEKGRHGSNRDHPYLRVCKFCCTEDHETLRMFFELPFMDPIVEDEIHVLRTCPQYHALRYLLPDILKTAIFSDVSSIFQHDNVKRSSLYITKIFKLRFPKKD